MDTSKYKCSSEMPGKFLNVFLDLLDRTCDK
jgi:hypothetical protein